MIDLTVERAETFWVRLYLAGDIEQAKQVCREECMAQGLCVTVARRLRYAGTQVHRD